MSNAHNTNNPPSGTASVDSVRFKSSHLSCANIRGLIKLFNYYFIVKDANGKRKRLPRKEMNDRWISYKKKVFTDYGKVIKGTLNSEKAFVKRYSEPLSFLKYKLKRSTNLKVSDLSPSDQAYYYEIGGSENVQELIEQQLNIDSISKATNRMKRKRRRMTVVNTATVSESIINNDNNDIPPATDFDFQPSQSAALTNTQSSQQQIPQATIEPKLEPRIGKFGGALDQLDQKLTAYEQEQLEKKKQKCIV